MRLLKVSKFVVAVATVAVAVSFAQAQKQPQPKKEELTKMSVKNASKSMSFEAAEVRDYLDVKTPIAILDIGEAETDPISLNRSFKDALKENIDKESVERIAR
jgi:hypothetical protein